MAEAHVVGALRKKRAEIFGRIIGLEKELRQRRADMKHVDATLRLFAPSQSLSKPSARPAWLRRGEGSRLVLGVLRDADKPLMTLPLWNVPQDRVKNTRYWRQMNVETGAGAIHA